jgi:uncharacterized protein YegL
MKPLSPIESPPWKSPLAGAAQVLPGSNLGCRGARKLPVERSLFVEELEQLARLAAFRPQLRMVVGRPGSGWFFNWVTDTISIDGGRLETEPEDFVRGLVLHESAHAAITRLGAIVPLALLKDRRLFALLNVVEDCRIETWMMQIRFPGCRPWVREYNDRLFKPVLAADVERPPAAQFLNGILTRWWFGEAAGPMSGEARQALDLVWPAIERVLEALPPSPDALGEVSSAYARSPVSRCYTVLDEQLPPDAFEQVIRMAQHKMWAIVHQDILPVYLRLLPPEDNLGKSLRDYFSLLEEASSSQHLLGSSCSENAARSNLFNRLRRRDRNESPLAPTGQDPYLRAWREQYGAIELLAENLLRWFQAHGRRRLRPGCPWGTRLDLRAAMRFEADPRLYNRLWSRPLVPERIDPHFSVLIDRSGSMRGERIEQTFRGAVLLCEVCRRVGLRLNIYAFGSQAERLLHHDEPLSSRVRARLGSLPDSAFGDTNLTAALELVAADLSSSPYRDRFVFLLSDGEPDDAESAREQIARLAEDEITVLGLGLGPETLRLRELLPRSRVNLAAGELPGALAALLVHSLRGA